MAFPIKYDCVRSFFITRRNPPAGIVWIWERETNCYYRSIQFACCVRQVFLLHADLRDVVRQRSGVSEKPFCNATSRKQWTGIMRAAELFHLAKDKETYAKLTANLRCSESH
ncbi:hypothetical protein evm_005521 [Chilo suppressalis]|nr:hypothetical protein evm_005521 [Chilo suppressalis]